VAVSSESEVKAATTETRSGSELEFRIAPEHVESSRAPSPLTIEEMSRYGKDLAQNGPQASRVRGDKFAWFEIKSGANVNSLLVTGEYQGAKYLLLHNSEPFVMLPRQGWRLVKAAPIKDAAGRPNIQFELDEKGAELFSGLTEANRGSLAIVIDGKVVSAPTVRAAIRNKGIIIGNFTEREAERIAVGLRKGMPAGEKSVPALDEAGAFEELSVKFGGMWIHWQDFQFTVRGNGSVAFSMNIGPRDKTKYKTAFKLSDEHLAQLSELLQKTNWLTAPGANVQPGYTDATRIDISLTREDKVQKVWCHDRNAEPYLSLIIFLKRIQRQEYLLYQMTVPGAFGRNSAFNDIYQQIRAEKGEPVSVHPHPILDFSRFVPVSIDVITHPDDNHYETVAIATKILGKLKAEQVRRQITDLTTAERKEQGGTAAVIRTENIRSAAVEVLTELGGEQARLHIRDMAKNHTSWRRQVNEAIVEGLLQLDRDNCAELLKDMTAKTREASWGLIRLGPAALPAILEMLEVRDTKYMGQIYLIRQYIDNWENVDKPIDPRVIEAVQNNLDYRLGRSTSWTNYHKEFLQLAGAPELPSKDPRQIAQEFLAAVKANDQMKIGVVALTRGGSWPQRLAKLRALPHLQQLEITEVYADTNDNIAWAIAAATGPDNENSTRARIIFFLSGSVWRVFNIAIERPEIAERMRKRYLESHPNAKPVPAKASSGTELRSGVKVEGEETSRMSELVWGQVVEGLKAVLLCKSKAIAGGEPVIVELSLLNESDKNITYYDFKKHNLVDDGHVATVLVDGKAVGGYTTLDVSAESNKAMVVRGRDNLDTGPGIIVPIPPIPREAFQVLKPGEKTTYLKVDLQPAWFKHVTEKNHKGPLQIPGEYTIEVEYHNTARGEQFNLKAWTGRVKSNTIKVHIGAARSTGVLSMEVKNLLRKLERLEDEHLKIRKEKWDAMSDAEKRRLMTHNMDVMSGLEEELRTLLEKTARRMAAFGEAAAPILLEELRNLSSEIHYQRRSIARSLRQIGRPAVPYLIEALRAGGPRDKVALARYKDVIISTLGEIRDSRAVEPLLVLFDKNKESSISWRAAIATALGFICDKRAVEPLIFELDACLGRAQESGEWDADGLDMRAYAGALGRLGDSRALPVLKRALNAGPQKTKGGVLQYLVADEAARALRSLGVQVEGKDKTLVLRLGDKTDVEVEGTGQKELKITFEKTTHDFGQISPGSTNSCEFTFTNTGDSLLKIGKIDSPCGCTIPRLSKKEYAPGESETIKVRYSAGTHPGRVTKRLYVNSNDRARPRITLTIKATIVMKVGFGPKKLELLLKDENAGCPEITLTSLDNQPFAITQFKSTANSITADFEPSVKKTKFVLEPKVDMEQLRKALNGRISISLTHPQCRTVTIPFRTLPRFKITPPSLITLKAESQKPTKRKVRILNNYNEDFEIESASSQKGIVKVLSQEKTRGGYQFELEITPPVVEGNKRLFTDVFIVNIKGGEVLKISCRGFYSRK
jgi:HEAT repeat protein